MVAQLKAPATEEILQEATILDDKEVEKKMSSVLRHRRLRLMEDREGERSVSYTVEPSINLEVACSEDE